MSSELMNRMLKTGVIKDAEILSKSKYFNEKDQTTTEVPIINAAFSANLNGGMTSGLTMLAGASKSFKTLLMLLCMRAYLDQHEDAIVLLYTNEFGITQEYIKNNGIDIERVIFLPITDLEELKADMVKKLTEIKRGEKIFIGIDSIGNLASRKEIDDALENKQVADMTRAKQLKSFFRMVTPHFTMKNIPCIAINHVYKSMSLYPTDIVSGGTGGMYSADNVFIISRSQEKDGKDLNGWNFTINIEKSRYVKEKSKFQFTVLFDKGIQKYSGLFDLALELGYIERVSAQLYKISAYDNEERKRKYIENNAEIWDLVLNDANFNKMVYDRFSYGNSKLFAEPENIMDEDLDD